MAFILALLLQETEKKAATLVSAAADGHYQSLLMASILVLLLQEIEKKAATLLRILRPTSQSTSHALQLHWLACALQQTKTKTLKGHSLALGLFPFSY